MINVTIDGDAQFVARLEAMPQKLNNSLLQAITGACISLEAYIKGTQLSGAVLKVQTGQLRNSIQHTVQSSTNQIIGEVFSAGNIPYAAIHEYGGVTKPHDIYPVTAQALYFNGIFAKVAHHPGSKIPERSYMRSALADKTAEIQERISTAVQEATA